MADWWRFWHRSRPATPPAPPARLRTSIRSAEEAERLLWSKLTRAQRLTYPHGYFDVTGSLGGLYRIHTHSTVQNITDNRFRGATEYCVTLAGASYRQHVWLAQKILIESDEPRFLRTAVSYLARGVRQRYTDTYYW